MKHLMILLTLFLSISCNKVNLSGKYKCSKIESNEKDVSGAISDMAAALTGKDCIYDEIEFRGNNTAIIYAMGIEYPTSYTIDDNYIKIKTDQGDLLLKISDKHTLIGEGFAKGKYVKE